MGFSQNVRQPLQGLLGVDHAGGVVGAVHHHALGVGGEGLLKGGEVDLEVLDLRGDEHHLGSGPLDKHLVLGEVGGKNDELVLRAGEAVEHAAQGGCRAHGEVELIGGVVPAEAPVQGIGKPLPGGGVSLGAGVAVDQVGLLLQNADGRLIHLGRGGDAGIAQREVIHVLPADDGGPLVAVLEQLPDHRAGGAQPKHAFGNHDTKPPGNQNLPILQPRAEKGPLRQDGFGLIIARLFNAVKRRFLLRFSRFFPFFHQYTRQNVFYFFELTKF